jgi:hypothetical protein
MEYRWNIRVDSGGHECYLIYEPYEGYLLQGVTENPKYQWGIIDFCTQQIAVDDFTTYYDAKIKSRLGTISLNLYPTLQQAVRAIEYFIEHSYTIKI